jgi:D-xylose transport system substrate-binding protein
MLRVGRLLSLSWLALSVWATDLRAESLKIGLSLPTQAEERWVRDKNTMVETAKSMGVDLRVQITNNDAAKQVAQSENLLAQGVKVLILAPHDAESAAVIVQKAKKAGVKVISYDRLILNSEPDVYISFDNEKVGEMQGEYLTKLVAKGNYVVLAGAPTDNNAKLYRDGAMKFIQPLVDKGDIKIVMDQSVKDWQPSEAQKLMEQALTANQNKIDAVLAPNDGTAGGAIQALAAQGLAGKVPVTGQDAELSASIRIVQGTQSMTIFKDTRLLGAKAVELAVKMAKNEPITSEVNAKLNNKKIDVPSVLLPIVVVDKASLDKTLIDSGYLKRELVYKGK